MNKLFQAALVVLILLPSVWLTKIYGSVFSSYNTVLIAGTAIGGLIGISLFSTLFRYALLGRSGTKTKHLWVVMLTGVVAIGFSAFGDGTDGFVNRITNMPNMVQVIAYGLSTLVVAAFVSWKYEATAVKQKPKTGAIVGRAFALVFVIPMIIIGIGNLAGSAYSLAVNAPPPGKGLGVSHAEFRQIMLDGDMAPFWRVVDERAPDDMARIIEGMFAHEDDYYSVEDGHQQFNAEVVNYRIELATYGPALSDHQRKAIIRSTIDLLRKFESKPNLCSEVAMTGGSSLTQAQMLTAKDEFNHAMIIMTASLLDAREAAAAGVQMPVPPTEEDYAKLLDGLDERGVSEEALQAIINSDTTHPDFCTATIVFMELVLQLDGAAGKAVRFEVSQAMMVGAR